MYLKYKKKYLNLKSKMLRGGGEAAFSFVDEVHFWGRQMMEHALFLYLGLEDEKYQLKNKAQEIYNKWQGFMGEKFYSKGINVGKDTVFLTEGDIAKIGEIDKEEVLENIALIKNFKQEVVSILGTGKWIGWIFPSMAKHILDEAVYFEEKVRGTSRDEIKYIVEHHMGEIGVTAQLIDPSEQSTIDLVRSYALLCMAEFREGRGLANQGAASPFPKVWTKEEEAILKSLDTENANLLVLSIRYSKELDELAGDTGKKIESNQLKTVISPILANHVYREFARFTKTLERLQGKGAI